ncbi:MAG: hypothetical protein BGO32_11120 [Bacteroidetes bacterium 37-13]|nr:MAG: hypothetical protein BGO32_11120 [Bacteroidetes bacterium 37-13]
MIAVLPSYQKVETGLLPNVPSSEGFVLNIEIAPQQISATVEVAVFKQFLYLVEFNFSKPLQAEQFVLMCEKLFATEPIFAMDFKEVKVMLHAEIDLLPVGFKQFSGNENMLQLSNETFALFSDKNGLAEVVKTKFPIAEVTAVGANFLKNILPLPKGIYVLVMNEKFSVAILDAPEKLLLYNTFEFKTIEDFLYFLLLVCESTQVNRTESPLVLCGKVQKESKIYDSCYRYFSNIVFLKPGNGKFYSKAISEDLKSIHFSLFSM